MKYLHSIEGVNYSLDFFLESNLHDQAGKDGPLQWSPVEDMASTLKCNKECNRNVAEPHPDISTEMLKEKSGPGLVKSIERVKNFEQNSENLM